jgi:hypothetical protein
MRTKMGAHEDLGAQEALDTKQALQVYSAQFQLTYLSIDSALAQLVCLSSILHSAARGHGT